MTFEDFLIALAVEAPKLSNNGLRVLLHLVARSIETGSHSVTVSDRDLCNAVGMGDGHIGEVKRSLAHLVAIHAAVGRATTFELPHEWFPLQTTLFGISTDPARGSLLTPNRGHWRPRDEVTGAPASGSTDPERGSKWPRTGGALTPNGGQLTPNGGQSDPVTGAPSTQNQQHSNGSSTRLDSTQTLTSTEYTSRLDRIFHTVQIAEDRLPSALRLRLALHEFMRQRGKASAAERPPKEEILAKCLAIADVDELLVTLNHVADTREPNPGAYIWFVVMFLDQIGGVPHKTTADYLKRQKERKPPQRQAAAGFQHELVAQAANQVKGLR